MKIPCGKFVSPSFSQSCRLNVSAVTTTRKRVVRLAHDVIGGTTGSSPIIVLHGLFGWKNNWATLAKKMHKETKRSIITVDARNHGNSEQGNGMSIEAMRDDLLSLIKNDLQLDRYILIGHSLGGRTAMATALSEPQLIDKLVVVDVSPVRTHSIFTFPEFIAAMKTVQFDQRLSISQNRKSAGNQLKEVIADKGLLQFILTNVIERDGRCQWRLNLEALEDGIPDILADFPPFNSCYDGPVSFIRGSKSDYVRTEHLPAITKLFPAATISTVEGAGHFVHSEKPKEFLDVVVPFLMKS